MRKATRMSSGGEGRTSGEPGNSTLLNTSQLYILANKNSGAERQKRVQRELF